jgi:ABC-type multidrug transport system fused ATPase/permease subunit
VMSNGEIIERGTHQELMNSSGLYADLFSRQDLTTNK